MKKMKHLRRWILLAACLLLVLIPAAASAAVKNGWNASKAAKRTAYYNKGKKVKGLWKIGSDFYYFNGKGKLQKNKWKSLKGSYTKLVNQKKGTTKKVKTAGTFRFRFDKNGKAIRSKVKAAVKLGTVKTKQYGFDEMGHLVSGIRISDKNKMCFLGSSGVYDKARSAELQALVKTGKTSETLMDDVIAAFGEPRTMTSGTSCNPFDLPGDQEIGEIGELPYTDIVMVYDFFEIGLTRNDNTGVYYMQGAFTPD